MADNNNLIVYCEYDEGRVADVSLELLTKGRVLADKLHYDPEHDFVVVSVDGAKGMEQVIKHRELNCKTMVVWITSDRYFAAMAIRYQVFEFLTRPFDEADFRAAVKRFLAGDIHPQYKLPVKPVGMVPAETL